MGLTWEGEWIDPELRKYTLRISSHQRTPEEAVRVSEALCRETEASEKLAPLVDDALLRKARIFFVLKRYGEAQEVFRTVVQKCPAAEIDLAKGRVGPRSGLREDPQLRAISKQCTYYCLLQHPNKSAGAARLGLAQCAIALEDYDKAEDILAELVPAGEERPPSEDPLVRTPGPDGYMAFYNDSRFRDLVAQRHDKIALLWRARVKVLQGKKDQARDLYETMLSLFPASGKRAEYELELLNSGKMDELAETVSLHLMNPRFRVTLMREEKVLEILKLPEQAQRIEAAKAYYAGFHNGLKEEVDRLRRKRDKLESQEATPVE